MKVINILICLALIVMPSSSFSGEFSIDSIQNPINTSAQSVEKGKTLYTKWCAVCHGKDADGKGPSADGFAVAPWSFVDGTIDELSDGLLFQRIKNGGTWFEMAPFGLGLSDDEIWSTIVYLRSLKK